MISNGSKYFQIVPKSPKLFQFTSKGSKRFKFSKWFQMVPNEHQTRICVLVYYNLVVVSASFDYDGAVIR